MKELSSKFYSGVLFSLLGISGLMYILFVLEVVPGSLMLNWCFILLGIAALVSIVFPIIGMANNFSKAKGSLIGVGALVLIFIISYFMSSSEVYNVSEGVVVEGAVSKKSEAGLITLYFMFFIAIGAIVYTEISKAFK